MRFDPKLRVVHDLVHENMLVQHRKRSATAYNCLSLLISLRSECTSGFGRFWWVLGLKITPNLQNGMISKQAASNQKRLKLMTKIKDVSWIKKKLNINWFHCGKKNWSKITAKFWLENDPDNNDMIDMMVHECYCSSRKRNENVRKIRCNSTTAESKTGESWGGKGGERGESKGRI